MSSDIKLVNVGAVANDGTGDAMRSAFQQVNSNFSNVDSRISTGNFGVVYSGTYIQANLTLSSLGSTTTETLEVNQTANIAGNTRIENLSVNNAFVSSTITSTGNTYVQDSLNVTNNAAISKNLVVGGNLTVLGSTVNIGSADLTIQDSLINLHTDPSLSPLTFNDGKDIGLQFHYYKTTDKHAALVLANDSTALEFYVDGVESAGNTFSGTYGNIKVGSLFAGNTTATTNTTTGAIVTRGGIAAAGNIAATNFLGNVYGTQANVGNLSVSGYVVGSMNFTGLDTIYINGSAVATSAASFAGGVVPGYSLFNAVLETRGNLFANSQVASTSTITGALVVNGGAGISGAVYAGSVQASAIGSVAPGTGAFTTLSSGNLVLTNGLDSSGITTGALVVSGGIGMSGNLYVGGSINNTSIGVYGAGVGNFTTMNATNLATTTTIKAGGNIVAGSGTASGNVSTGAMVVIGGLGVSGNINANNINVTNNINAATVTGTFSGTASITGGSVTGITGQASTFTATNFSSGNIVGVLTGTASTANVALYQSVNNSVTNATYFLEFSDRSTTGNAASYVTSGITVNPSTNSISATNLTGTLQTAAQPNITSVGTLTSLAVTGNVTAGNVISTFYGDQIGNSTGTSGTFTNVTGTLQTAAQPNVTSLGTLSSLVVTGNVTAGNVAGAQFSGNIVGTTGKFSGNVDADNVKATIGDFTTVSGTLSTAAQPNVTSLGTLTGLVVNGNVAATHLNGMMHGNIVGATGLFSSNVTSTGYVAFGLNADLLQAGVLGFVNDSYGFTTQYNTAVIVTNQQGATTQTLFLGDTSTSNNSTLLGVSVNNTPVLNLTGTGNLTVTGNVYASNVIGTQFNGNVVGTVTGNISGTTASFSTVTGTLQTAAQPNITSVGTLTSLAVAGNVTAGNVNSTFYGDVHTNNISGINGNLTITVPSNSVAVFSSDQAVKLPIGNSYNRPSGVAGYIRYNTDTLSVEFFDGTSWVPVTNKVTSQTFNGDGVNNTYVLTHDASIESLLVTINGTVQQAGAYTVSAGQITFAEIPLTTDAISIRYLGGVTSFSGVVSNDLTIQGNLTLSGILSAPQTTKASNATGTPGQVCWDANYIYVCTAPNTWKRSPLTGGY